MEKILIVDDETHIVRILKNYLKSESYDVYTATNGLDAIQKVMEVNPRIVLLDIIIPGMGGIDVLKEIKKINPKTAVFMITAVIDDELAKRALQCGADDYITKPFNIVSIGKRIRIKMLELLHSEDEDENEEEKTPASPAKKILLIDDEADFCRALKKGLEMKGNFSVLTATGADEGILLAKIQKPDVILLDIMMPDKAGTAVAEELLADPATSSIPIIFVTAIVKENEIKKRDGLVGGHVFMAKPVIIDELIGKINIMSPACV
jgi:DNA-binding response OmpR family regulator